MRARIELARLRAVEGERAMLREVIAARDTELHRVRDAITSRWAEWGRQHKASKGYHPLTQRTATKRSRYARADRRACHGWWLIGGGKEADGSGRGGYPPVISAAAMLWPPNAGARTAG